VISEDVAKSDFHCPHYTHSATLYLTNNLMFNTIQNYTNRTVCITQSMYAGFILLPTQISARRVRIGRPFLCYFVTNQEWYQYLDEVMHVCIDVYSLAFIKSRSLSFMKQQHTGWRTKCHTIDCACNTFLLLQKYLTSGTELILIGRKIVPNEEHVQCDHRFALRCTTFSGLQRRPENVVQLRSHTVKLCHALSEDLSCDECKGSFARGCEAKRWSH